MYAALMVLCEEPIKRGHNTYIMSFLSYILVSRLVIPVYTHGAVQAASVARGVLCSAGARSAGPGGQKNARGTCFLAEAIWHEHTVYADCGLHYCS